MIKGHRLLKMDESGDNKRADHGSFLCSHECAIYAKKMNYFIASRRLYDGIQTTAAVA